MSRDQEIKVRYSSSFFSSFSSPLPKEAEKTAILKDLKIEMKQLAKIANDFSRISEYFNQITTQIAGETDQTSITPEIKGLFSFYDTLAKAFEDANTALYKLASDLRDIFLSNLSFDEKCITAIAGAEIAHKIFISLVTLPAEYNPCALLVIGNSLHLLMQTIDNICSLAAQGQGLCNKPVALNSEPVKPFTGPSFSLT